MATIARRKPRSGGGEVSFRRCTALIGRVRSDPGTMSPATFLGHYRGRRQMHNPAEPWGPLTIPQQTRAGFNTDTSTTEVAACDHHRHVLSTVIPHRSTQRKQMTSALNPAITITNSRDPMGRRVGDVPT